MLPHPVLCDDRDAPGEVPHPAVLGEDRCEFHLGQYGRWESREARARQRLAGTGKGRGPEPYEKIARPPRYLDVSLTKAQAGAITEAVAEVAVLKGGLDVAVDGGLPRIPAQDLRPLLRALNALFDALKPLRGH